MAHHAAKLPACANCHYTFVPSEPDMFCPRCGQQNHALAVDFGHVAEEFLEGVFHFDGKVFRTLRRLLLQPGELTRQFLAGHRVPYVPPIRLYVFISFVFFFLLSLGSGGEEGHEGVTVHVARVEHAPAAAHRPQASIRAALPVTEADFNRLPEYPTVAQADSFARVHHLGQEWQTRFVLMHLPHLKRLPPGELEHKLLKAVSISLFVLMPLAALLLLLAYQRQQPYYLAHLIDAVHLHCFAFVVLTGLLVLNWLPVPDGTGVVIALLILPVYLVLALRRLYAQNWGRTLLKGSLLVAGYGVLLTLALGAALALGLVLA